MLTKEQIKHLDQINLLLTTQNSITNDIDCQLENWCDEKLEILIEDLLGKDDNGSDE